MIPELVLASHDKSLRFKESERWEWLEPQTAGVACHHPAFWGRRLPLRDAAIRGAVAINDYWLDTNAGAFGITLTEINQYAGQLREHFGEGVTCDSTFAALEEALYPIDFTAAAVAALSTETLPDNLDGLCVFDRAIDQFCGCVGRWRLYLIGENSD